MGFIEHLLSFLEFYLYNLLINVLSIPWLIGHHRLNLIIPTILFLSLFLLIVKMAGKRMDEERSRKKDLYFLLPMIPICTMIIFAILFSINIEYTRRPYEGGTYIAYDYVVLVFSGIAYLSVAMMLVKLRDRIAAALIVSILYYLLIRISIYSCISALHSFMPMDL